MTESSQIAEGTPRVELAHIPESNREVFGSMKALIEAALPIDQEIDKKMKRKYIPENFLLSTPKKVKEFLQGPLFNPKGSKKKLDSLQGFSATRGGFHQRLMGPGIIGGYDRETEEPFILLGPTSSAGNPFRDEIVPGIEAVVLGLDGTVKDYADGRELTDDEKKTVVKILHFTRRKIENFGESIAKPEKYNRNLIGLGRGISLAEYLAAIDDYSNAA